MNSVTQPRLSSKKVTVKKEKEMRAKNQSALHISWVLLL